MAKRSIAWVRLNNKGNNNGRMAQNFKVTTIKGKSKVLVNIFGRIALIIKANGIKIKLMERLSNQGKYYWPDGRRY